MREYSVSVFIAHKYLKIIIIVWVWRCRVIQFNCWWYEHTENKSRHSYTRYAMHCMLLLRAELASFCSNAFGNYAIAFLSIDQALIVMMILSTKAMAVAFTASPSCHNGATGSSWIRNFDLNEDVNEWDVGTHIIRTLRHIFVSHNLISTRTRDSRNGGVCVCARCWCIIRN